MTIEKHFTAMRHTGCQHLPMFPVFRLAILIAYLFFSPGTSWASANELSELLEKAKAATQVRDFKLAEELLRQISSLSVGDQSLTDHQQAYIGLVAGDIYRSQNKLGKAQGFYRTAYQVLTRTNSNAEADFRLLLCGRLGEVSIGTGNIAEAENTMRECLSATTSIAGGFNTNENYCKGVFIQVLLANRKLPEAETIARQQLAEAQKNYAVDSIEAALALKNLSLSIRGQDRSKRISDARKYMEQAFRICRARLGTENQQCVDMEVNLAEIEMVTNNYGAAEKYAGHALEVRKKTLGEKNPLTGSAAFVLGSSYFYQSRFEQALPILKKVDAIFSTTYGSRSPYTETSQRLLVECLKALNRTEEVAELERKRGLWIIR